MAGRPHADGIISQLNYYIRHGFQSRLTAHTPRRSPEGQTKVAYLAGLKEIALTCKSAAEMKAKVQEKARGLQRS